MLPLPLAEAPTVLPGRISQSNREGPAKSETDTSNIRFRHIELEINVACDLDCFGCDRFSDVTTAPNMTVEQVKLFVDESIELEYKWDRIRILGGEPTIHPQLTQIVHELLRYRRFYSKVFIQLLSNGRGKLNKPIKLTPDSTTFDEFTGEVLSLRSWLIDLGIDPHVEAKNPGVTPAWFVNTRVVPVDRDPNVGELEPCGIFGTHGCGIGLTRHGYFLDGAGAAVARVAGIDCGVQHLKDVTWDVMIGQAKVLCRLCGHWNDPRTGLRITKDVKETGEVTGAFWIEALRKYKEHPPAMRIYGQS